MAAFANIQTRQDIFDSITRVKQLTQKPSDFLTDLLVQQQQFACIEWIWHFKVLTQIPLPPGSTSYADVATKIQVPESSLRAVTRMAMTVNFLCETKDGRLAHNSLSAVFVEDANLATWLSYLLNRSVPCMRAFTQATEKWPSPMNGNETAYNVAMNTHLSFFEHLKADSDLSSEFGNYMKSQSTVHTGASVDHLLEGLDWDALGDAKVVDVGGNSGSASLALAKTFPNLRFVVEDLPEPIQNARAQVTSLPAEIAGRIEFVEHDFFTPQPVKDADVYLLRMIIHDWPDADAVRILKQLVEVMKEGSRIVIMDMVLPIPGTTSQTLEAALRQKDLMMRQVLNAKEREVEDWHTLVRKVDEGMHIVAIRRPEGSQHSIIEVSR
ncbi:hypothetical protein G7Y89_g10015 [Cudoniella acicularis]|uniref:O-methyltransferase C-terminal domain-containing protein n=1 Tax=Cudoniella acicularis TaxID=354080 RepID=A0A8H4VZG5_9HELO|nr:hypothetical protein G7Y89_g10015 [Cudoniella acicularis]